jgi:putative transcriptional regulator
MATATRIDDIARMLLVALCLATPWIGEARAQSKTQDEAAPLILVAKPGLRDAFFGSTILIAKPVGGGRHLGFVINRPTEVTLGRLFPEHGPSQKVPEPVYLGGPFNTEVIFALVHSSSPPSGEVLRLASDLYIAVDAKTVDHIIEAESSHARFFAGLVAWRPGELQEELQRGLWYVLESDADLVMRKSTDGLWEELVKRSQLRANTI